MDFPPFGPCNGLRPKSTRRGLPQ